MGCSSSIENEVKLSRLKILDSPKDNKTIASEVQTEVNPKSKNFNTELVLSSSIIIQKWYRRYKARLDLRRRCSWKIFQEIEYSAEQDQISLYNFFNEMVANVEKTGSVNNTNKGFAHLIGRSHLMSNPSLTEREKQVEIDAIVVEESYSGPHVQLPLTVDTIKILIEYFKSRKRLHSKYVQLILLEAKKQFSKLPNVMQINVTISKQVTIVGDLHGKYLDLLTIFNKSGLPSPENPYIFNGDFVDRGKRSLETLLILCCFSLLYPDHVILNRGNHEDFIMNSRYGFTKEVSNKYKTDGGKIMDLCAAVFSWMPLATIIGNKIFVVHGGVSDRTDLEKLMKVRRNLFSSVLRPSHVTLQDDEPPSLEVIQEWEQILDLLWSDPQCKPGKVFNRYRGGGCCFGPDITKTILDKYNWDLLIRSHECKFEGYEYTHNNKVLTIFSVSSYYAESSNFGAYIKIDIDLKPRIIQFSVQKKSLARRSVPINEDIAFHELTDKIYSCHEELMKKFHQKDSKSEGKLAVNEWTEIMEQTLNLQLPWYLIRPKLVVQDVDGSVLYNTMFEGYKINSAIPMGALSETIYRNKQVLETVFRIIDKDCSGFVSQEEFEDACQLLNTFSKGIVPDQSISDLARALDINKDGMIDFNEFLEAFRLVSLSVNEGKEGGNSVEDNPFQRTNNQVSDDVVGGTDDQEEVLSETRTNVTEISKENLGNIIVVESKEDTTRTLENKQDTICENKQDDSQTTAKDQE